MIRATADNASGAAGVVAEEELLGKWRLLPAWTRPANRRRHCSARTKPTSDYCTTAPRQQTPYPKDGINDHVIHGADTVNPAGQGTKMAFWYRVTVAAGETVELRLRLTRDVPGKTPISAPASNKFTPIGAGKPTSTMRRLPLRVRATMKRR